MSSTEGELSTRDLVDAGRQPEPDDRADHVRSDGLDSDVDDVRTDGTRHDEPVSDRASLFSDSEAGSLRQRWESVQTTFVDDPRAAVQHADGLVAQVVRQLAETFSDERERLEKQWASGDDVSTEDLRVALQRYRAFFNRLLDI